MLLIRSLYSFLLTCTWLYSLDGTLQLDVRDYFGNPLEEVEIQIDGRSAKHFVKGQPKTISLPYGNYEISVSAAGFDSVIIRSNVRQELQQIQVGMPLGSLVGEEPDFRLRGRVSQSRDGEDQIFLKIAAVYGDVSMTAYPDSTGNFEVVVKHGGMYLINALIKNRVCATDIVTVAYGKKPITLNCALRE